MSVEIQTHEPGRARRFNGLTDRAAFMAAHSARCASNGVLHHRPINKYELFDAFAYWPNATTDAVPKITGAEARLLAVYFSVIPPEDIVAGKAIGSMAIEMLCAKYGADESRVRLLRRSIESKCLAWRSYDGGNHQATRDGFDLTPTLDMARAIHAELRGRVAEVYARRNALRETLDTGDQNNLGARVKPSRLTQASSQPPKGRGEEVQGKAESGSSPDSRRTGRSYGPASNAGDSGKTGSCSAGRAIVSAGVKPATREEAAIIIAALSEARQASKSLRAATSQADIDRLNLAALCSSIVRALPSIAPKFPVATFEWAWREHGWRAIPALAVALDLPGTGNRGAYLGAWVRGHFPVRDNWASNFKRMIRAEEEAALAAGIAAPSPADVPPSAEEEPAGRTLSPRLIEAVQRYMKFEDPTVVMRWAKRAADLGAPLGPVDRWAAWIVHELPPGWSS